MRCKPNIVLLPVCLISPLLALATTARVESCADPTDLDDHQPPADLPGPWKDQLPRFQQEWIRQALFQANPQTGKRELVSNVKLWWSPPQPLLIHTQPPASPVHFFGQPAAVLADATQDVYVSPCLCSSSLWQAQANSSRTLPDSFARCWTSTGGMTLPLSTWNAKAAQRSILLGPRRS